MDNSKYNDYLEGRRNKTTCLFILFTRRRLPGSENLTGYIFVMRIIFFATSRRGRINRSYEDGLFSQISTARLLALGKFCIL